MQLAIWPFQQNIGSLLPRIATVHKCIATKSCVSNTRGGAEFQRPRQRLEKDFEQAEASVPAVLEIATGLNVSMSPRCANMWFQGPLVWLQM